MKVCKALQEIMEDERAEARKVGLEEGRQEGRQEGREEGADMLARLLMSLEPGGKEFNKALRASARERMKLYKKYGIVD
ncbi:hypothetical protein [Butyrivibrio sp. MC2013]|uniref:hypothetical protein n=1 Tax=Butyrivibrio sp. MC2013 TaxID=1280686 RepID=UPI0012DD892E|nr:hypothetical protein [Butyrivibrio sp. MC2013]